MSLSLNAFIFFGESSISWLRVIWFPILFPLWVFFPSLFASYGFIAWMMSLSTILHMSHRLHELVCMIAWCGGPFHHSDGARVKVAEYVVSFPERSYVLQGGNTFPSRLFIHTFDASYSAMFRYGRQTMGFSHPFRPPAWFVMDARLRGFYLQSGHSFSAMPHFYFFQY